MKIEIKRSPQWRHNTFSHGIDDLSLLIHVEVGSLFTNYLSSLHLISKPDRTSLCFVLACSLVCVGAPLCLLEFYLLSLIDLASKFKKALGADP